VSYSPFKTSYPLEETNYPSGAEVTVTAKTARGYVFAGWLIDTSTWIYHTVTIKMDGNKTLTAVFMFGGVGSEFTDTRDGQTYRAVTIGKGINYLTPQPPAAGIREHSAGNSGNYGEYAELRI